MSHFWINEKKVFYEDEGSGKPIVLLNGIMMSTRSWAPFVDTFKANNRLIRVDFFDQGQTDKLLGATYTHQIQVDLLKSLFDHLKLEQASIVGISYGGEIAIQFAIQHKSKVDRLVLFNTAAYTNPWLKDIGRAWMAAGKTRDGEAYYNTAIPVIYSPLFYETNQDWMQNRRKVLVPVFSNALFLDQMERLTQSSESYDVRNTISTIEAETLIVSAEEDYLTPVDNQSYVAKAIKNSHWVKIPGAGHASMYEKPLLFSTLCLGFINAKDTKYTI
ncbi:alpha/beta fold hydrolase [Paracholeplasma manati]|uniref:Alpha/beta hydrolase n=1 Tax=Paracholeplasma manati TaxID=591373 RepID=A0ABT2Y6F2_9MOLU|nr:alpha/beta hydrolase [Paracholeplasma manati]MCV2232310.1 alpha/beta hydrolase [Paracholeplasma manati]MDG0888267.1 alpha/beta hydrolase [Paracholeplasma manati]